MEQSIIGDWEIQGDADFLAGADVDIDDRVRQQAAAAILAKAGLIVREKAPTKSRRFPIGFTSDGVIPAGGSAVIVTRPQVLFKGERLSVPSDIAGDFVIDDIKVGKNSMFAAESSLPARCMQEDAIDVSMQLNTAQISQDVSIAVTNISGADRTFRAMLVGKVAEV